MSDRIALPNGNLNHVKVLKRINVSEIFGYPWIKTCSRKAIVLPDALKEGYGQCII